MRRSRRGKQLRRRRRWLENGGKWLEENAWLEEYVACWINKLWNCLDIGGNAHHLLNGRIHADRSPSMTYSFLKLIWLAHISTSFFCRSVSVFSLSVSPNFYSLVLSYSLLSSTLLQSKEVVCVQTNTGWKTVLYAGKAKSRALRH